MTKTILTVLWDTVYTSQ